MSVSNDNSSNLVGKELDILLIHGQDKWGIKLGDRWDLRLYRKENRESYWWEIYELSLFSASDQFVLYVSALKQQQQQQPQQKCRDTILAAGRIKE